MIYSDWGKYVDSFLPIILSAGGTAFLGAIFKGLQNLNSQKMESESAMIQRLNDAIAAGANHEDELQRSLSDCEQRSALMRLERDSALDELARARRRLIEAGLGQ